MKAVLDRIVQCSLISVLKKPKSLLHNKMYKENSSGRVSAG